MEATKRLQQEEFCGLVLTYRVNDTLLCVPVEHVDSVIEPPAVTGIPNAPDYVIGAFMHRGQTALALSLRKLLKLPTAEQKTRKESLLVIWMGEQAIGYWVDEIKGMTDSARGHWSAVPALIRDQGITRALVCDGQVFFPLDLTRSNQFKELTRALDAFEKSKLQPVTQKTTEDLIKSEPPAAEPGLTTSDPTGLQGGGQIEEGLEEVAGEAEASVTAEVLPTGIEAFSLAESEQDDEPFEEKSVTIDDESETPVISVEAELPDEHDEDEYVIAKFPTDNMLEEGYEEHIAASTTSEYESDTAVIHSAAGVTAEVVPLQSDPQLQFDTTGQADAFLDQLVDVEAGYSTGLEVEENGFESVHEQGIAEDQVDAFEETYQALLKQDVMDELVVEDDSTVLVDEIGAVDALAPVDDTSEQTLEETPASETVLGPAEAPFEPDHYAQLRQDAIDAASMAEKDIIAELIVNEPSVDDLLLSEEADSFLPTSLPEEQAPALPDVVADEYIDEEIDISLPTESELAEKRQAVIDAVAMAEEDIIDEAIYDEPTLDDLSLTEEPYSFLPTSLPEEDESALADVGNDESIEDVIPDISPTASELAEQRQAMIDADATDEEDIIDEAIYDEPTLDDLSLTEEPYSLLPASLPEEDESALPDVVNDESIEDVIPDISPTASESAEQRQAMSDGDATEEEDSFDEASYDEPTLDDLSLIEEPYSLAPSNILEDEAQTCADIADDESIDEVPDDASLMEPELSAQLQVVIDASSIDEQELIYDFIHDEPTVDDLPLNNSSFLYNAGAPVVEEHAAPGDNDATQQAGQERQSLTLLPHLTADINEDDVRQINIDDKFSAVDDSAVEQRPVIILPYVDENKTVESREEKPVYEVDYYADLMSESLKKDLIPEKIQKNIGIDRGQDVASLPLDVEAKESAPADSATIYELPIPESPAMPEAEVILPPSLGENYIAPKLDPSGIIIRPDGQVNKSFGLVKLFTIILATSAAGSWWFRDELFYREHLRKEIPSILQNEIAFLYAERVQIKTPNRGRERVIVDTPDHEIKVIRANYVHAALLRQGRKKGTTIHRVKKGDTLLTIAKRYIESSNRYPELAENNRIDAPNLIRPGDVVKITKKKIKTDKP